MYRQIAESYESTGWTRIKALKARKPGSDLNNDLLPIMQNFLDAADNYFKDKCNALAEKSLKTAALIGLQITIPETKMINLNDTEIQQLMSFRAKFYDALIIANAYKKNDPANWFG